MTSARIVAAASLLVALVVGLPPAAQANTCLPGIGVLSDPFLVASQADLVKVGSGVDGCDASDHYRQTADITLTGTWTPLTSAVPFFSGVYDGGGFTISGLTVAGGSAYHGLFARATTNAEFRNLTLAGVDVAGVSETGGLVGDLGAGTVIDVTVSGAVSGVGNQIGGIAGSANGATLTRVRFSGTVSATGTSQGVGGIVGYFDTPSGGSSISGASFSGTVSSTGSSVGGIAGTTNATSGGAMTITTSWSEGSVEGTRQVGGLVGQMTRGSLTDSFSTAAVRITDAAQTAPDLGGLVGLLSGGTVTDVFARGVLTHTGGTEDVGGLVGDMQQTNPDNVLRRAYATGVVPGSGVEIGGLAGGPGDVDSDSFWDTATTGQSSSAAGTGKTTAELTTFATFSDTSTAGLTTAWAIVEGWAPYVAGTTVWGICPRVNDGYPFLLWEYASDPCVVPAAVVSAPSITVGCTGPDGGALRAGAVASCVLSGADPDIDILWRAAYNPAFAEGAVRTGADGTGTFAFTVPAAAAGAVLTVEPVAWTAPIVVGTVEGAAAGGAGAGSAGPVPSSIPAGGGAGFASMLALLVVLSVLGGTGVVIGAGRRRVGTPV